eukprot:UN07985
MLCYMYLSILCTMLFRWLECLSNIDDPDSSGGCKFVYILFSSITMPCCCICYSSHIEKAIAGRRWHSRIALCMLHYCCCWTPIFVAAQYKAIEL